MLPRVQQETGYPGLDMDDLLLQLLSCHPVSDGERLLPETACLQMALFDRACVHRAPVLFASILREFSSLAASVRRKVDLTSRTSLVRDLQLAHLLKQVICRFRKSQIPVLAYKGPALWRALGLPRPIRISGDIDLLVRREDRHRAGTALGDLGYVCSQNDPFESTYESPRSAAIDLHWSLLTMGGWGDHIADFVERTWQNPSMVDLDGIQVQTPSPTDMLLTLVLHAGCHHVCMDWTSLREIALCTLTWRREIDWEYFMLVSQLAEVRSTLFGPLWLAVEHFGADVPEEVLSCIKLPWCRKGLLRIARAGFQGRLCSITSLRTAAAAWNLLSQPDILSAAMWAARRFRHGAHTSRSMRAVSDR